MTLDPKKMHRIILWFRNDLRMHDNAVLDWAAKLPPFAYKDIIPVMCFDPRFYDKTTDYETRKCGIVRTRFHLETVEEFRKNLKEIGSNLLVAHEKAEDFIPKLMLPDK